MSVDLLLPLTSSAKAEKIAHLLGDRLMAGRQPLELSIEVRPLVPQPIPSFLSFFGPCPR